jgi:NAD(P)H-flavin reductase
MRAAQIGRETERASLYTFAPSTGSTLEGFEFVPGQVAALAAGDAESLIAIASPPSRRGCVEFLVKHEGWLGERLLELGADAEVVMRGPFGSGFPVEAYKGKDLVFVAMGTAIAPIRSALLHAIERRERFGQITLIYGARSPEDFAFTAEVDAWRTADVRVALTVTQPRSEWAGATGRVQAMATEAVRDALEPIAFVCGSGEMMDETAEVLAAAGLSRERILRNY